MVCALWRVLPKKGDTKILLRLAGGCWSVLRIIVMVAEWFCKAMCDFEPEISFSNLLSYKFYSPNKSSSDRNNNIFFSLPSLLIIRIRRRVVAKVLWNCKVLLISSSVIILVCPARYLKPDNKNCLTWIHWVVWFQRLTCIWLNSSVSYLLISLWPYRHHLLWMHQCKPNIPYSSSPSLISGHCSAHETPTPINGGFT